MLGKDAPFQVIILSNKSLTNCFVVEVA